MPQRALRPRRLPPLPCACSLAPASFSPIASQVRATDGSLPEVVRLLTLAAGPAVVSAGAALLHRAKEEAHARPLGAALLAAVRAQARATATPCGLQHARAPDRIFRSAALLRPQAYRAWDGGRLDTVLAVVSLGCDAAASPAACSAAAEALESVAASHAAGGGAAAAALAARAEGLVESLGDAPGDVARRLARSLVLQIAPAPSDLSVHAVYRLRYLFAQPILISMRAPPCLSQASIIGSSTDAAAVAAEAATAALFRKAAEADEISKELSWHPAAVIAAHAITLQARDSPLRVPRCPPQRLR